MALEITIDQNEIETAIKNHVGSLLTVKEGQNVNISLKAGRGENGFSATIEIGSTPSTQPTTTQSQPETAGPVVTGPFKRTAKATPAPAQEAPQATAQAEPVAGEPDPVATAGDDAGLDTPTEAPKAGLFAHLGNRTGTDKSAE
ncbi:hypothetical protein HYP93_gp68 [Stenotrophomonas phage Pokken]|uniref:Uncharacterized protein n=1 Tax=Stenotrophomonas phage Pokken TaxID=2596674 RepID=A0A5B9N6V1_9CAUD|nr:hypothetical protein HYP93_gp68 [Stenotrophomonas phage Pokken]QEG09289.1 hypothetical protein CPT_Pokken_071 [Stenotrophomonas phage Pokken]